MSLPRFYCFLLLLWGSAVGSATAQQPSAVRVVEVDSGSLVRVRSAAEASPLVGHLLRVHEETVVLAERRTGLEYTVELEEGGFLEVSLGQSPERAALRGALFGGVGGAVLGALLMGSMDSSGPGYEYLPGTRTQALLIRALIGGMSGGEDGASIHRAPLPVAERHSGLGILAAFGSFTLCSHPMSRP